MSHSYTPAMRRTTPQAAAANPNGDTRRRILDAARALFAEHGYSATSVRLIARTLGLSDPAVYYHFPTKRDLYKALLVNPEYGAMPLDSLPLTRENLISQVSHLLNWWSLRPEYGQMLLREQLTGQEASVAFLRGGDARWHDHVTVPLRELVGEGADEASEMLLDIICGVFWDGILSFGSQFTETAGQPFFQRRLRAMIDLAIPGPRADRP